MTSMLLTLTVFSGCCKEPEIQYVDKPVDVYIPVKCIVPDSNCSFMANTYTGVINRMRECIIDMKHNENVCK